MSDPYKVLGISRDATDEQVKEAYREMAKKYHPDNYQGRQNSTTRISIREIRKPNRNSKRSMKRTIKL